MPTYHLDLFKVILFCVVCFCVSACQDFSPQKDDSLLSEHSLVQTSGYPPVMAIESRLATSLDSEASKSGINQNHPTSAPSLRVLDVAKAREISIATSPQLASMRMDISAASGRTRQELLWENPVISGEVENIGSSDGGFNSAEVTIELHQQIPINGAKTYAAKAGEQEEIALEWEYEEQRRTVSSEAYLRFHQILIAQEKVKQWQSMVQTRQNFAEKILALVNNGKLSQTLFLKADIAQSQAKIHCEEAEKILAATKARLAIYLHIPVTNLPECEGSLLVYEQPLPPLEAFKQKLLESPQVKKWMAEQNKLQHQRSQATAEVIPNPDIFIGGRRDFSIDKNTLVAGLEFPLPVWNRQQGRIAELEALERKAWLTQAAVLESLHTELAEAYQSCQYSQKKLENYQKNIFPATQKSLQWIEMNYEQGKASIPEILDAKQIEIELQLEIFEELNNFYQARATLLRLCDE